MTTPEPLEPLLLSTDFAKFKSSDEAWFLGAAGDAVRDFCGWHLWPVRPVLSVAATVGNKGIIMLPTRRLVSVQAIRYNGPNLLSDNMFTAFEEGWLEFHGYMGRRGRGLQLAVDFTHGYDELPKPVAQVGFELAATAMEQPAGVVTDMTRGPSRLKFKDFGLILSDDQKERLGPYSLVRV